MNIIWNPTPNFTVGRRKYDNQTEEIIAIVDHKTAGKFPGCLNWMCNPAAKVSAHFLITRAGEIYQLVKLADTAWHAGIVQNLDWPLYRGYNPNRYTIGIEHEDYDGDGELGLTDAQYQASLELHKYLIKELNIPVTVDNIIGHYRIDSVDRPNCPGPYFPWQPLMYALSGTAGERRQDDVKIEIDVQEIPVIFRGKEVPNSTIMKIATKDTTMIPAVVLREYGFNVTWDGPNNRVIIE